MLARAGYLSDFCRFWSDRPEVRKIWFSIYTPQQGDSSTERLGLTIGKSLSKSCPLRRDFQKCIYHGS